VPVMKVEPLSVMSRLKIGMYKPVSKLTIPQSPCTFLDGPRTDYHYISLRQFMRLYIYARLENVCTYLRALSNPISLFVQWFNDVLTADMTNALERSLKDLNSKYETEVCIKNSAAI
jgi:hypothetical protein